MQKSEQTYKELLANNSSLTAQERKTLEDNLQTVQGQLRTKEQQTAIEKKELEERLSGKITEAEKKATEWENRYRSETMTRSLQDAAVNADAFRAEQIVTILKPMTKQIDEVDPTTNKATGRLKTMIEFPDVDDNGEPTMTTRTPEEAVKRMKELPHIYGNLFKTNVVSGIGSNSAAVVAPGATGKLTNQQLRNLTPAQYREIREKNPAALGLQHSHRQAPDNPSGGMILLPHPSERCQRQSGSFSANIPGPSDVPIELLRIPSPIWRSFRESSLLECGGRCSCFANDNDAFIPEIWAQEGLVIVEENMVAANLVHRDFEDEIKNFGDVVNTRRPGNFKVSRKADGVGGSSSKTPTPPTCRCR